MWCSPAGCFVSQKHFFEKIDSLADDEAPIHKINFNGSTAYKSSLGGFCTLTLAIIFILVLAKEGGEVLRKQYPFV